MGICLTIIFAQRIQHKNQQRISVYQLGKNNKIYHIGSKIRIAGNITDKNKNLLSNTKINIIIVEREITNITRLLENSILNTQ